MDGKWSEEFRVSLCYCMSHLRVQSCISCIQVILELPDLYDLRFCLNAKADFVRKPPLFSNSPVKNRVLVTATPRALTFEGYKFCTDSRDIGS